MSNKTICHQFFSKCGEKIWNYIDNKKRIYFFRDSYFAFLFNYCVHYLIIVMKPSTTILQTCLVAEKILR